MIKRTVDVSKVPAKERYSVKDIWKGIKRVLITIKRLLVLRIVFDNILSSQKYKKETKIPKDDVCVL